MAIKEVKPKEDTKDLTPTGDNAKEQVVSTTENKESGTDVREEVKQESVSMTFEQLKSLLEEQEKKLTAQFESRLQSVKSETLAHKEVKGEVQRGEDLLDDYMDVPATFFSYISRYGIYGDLRRGKESTPPNGGIKFSPLIRNVRKEGRGVTVVSICSAKTHSRAEADWLRSSPLFGITFYETVDGAVNVNAEKAQILVNASQTVGKYSDMEVINQSKQYQLAILSDIDLMRRNLTEHIAMRRSAQMDNYKKSLEKQASEMIEGGESGALMTVKDFTH